MEIYNEFLSLNFSNCFVILWFKYFGCFFGHFLFFSYFLPKIEDNVDLLFLNENRTNITSKKELNKYISYIQILNIFKARKKKLSWHIFTACTYAFFLLFFSVFICSILWFQWRCCPTAKGIFIALHRIVFVSLLPFEMITELKLSIICLIQFTNKYYLKMYISLCIGLYSKENGKEFVLFFVISLSQTCSVIQSKKLDQIHYKCIKTSFLLNCKYFRIWWYM